jgi:peptide deformylase
MTVLPLVIEPDPLLHEISQSVEAFDDNLKQFAQDMLDSMYAHQGIGLAAVQVGVLKRIIVMDIEQTEEGSGNPMVFINPEIIDSSEELVLYKEGCLSFPGHYSEVERPKAVTIRYQDVEGKIHETEADELLATCIQHEIDHTNGIVFVDHISRLKREMIIKKLKKAKKLANPESEVVTPPQNVVI